MTKGFWIKRFLVALVAACALLFVVQLAKGHTTTQAMQFAALWSLVSAALFTLIGHVRYKRNPACMLPRSGKP